MAVTVVTPVELVMNQPSASSPDVSGGVVATTPADGFEIAAGGRGGERMLLRFYATATDTVTIGAGTARISTRAGLGALAVALTAGQSVLVPVESARFTRTGGKILATCTHAGTRCTAFVNPKGLGGAFA